MNRIKYISLLLMISLLMVLMGCASSSNQEGTGEYVDNSVITTKVKTAIFNEPSLKPSEIVVKSSKGVVQLSGFVSAKTDIVKAGEIARGVKGVTSVKNNLQLK